MYIRRKKIHYTSTFRQSCCLSLRFHSPPSALLSLATCLERAKTFYPGLKFSETDLQSEHLLFHVLTHLVSTAWWFYWRWSEKKRFTSCSFCIIFFTSCSPASLQFPFYTITRSWSQMRTFSRISLCLKNCTFPQLQFPPESRDLGDLLLQGGGHPLLPALVPV